MDGFNGMGMNGMGMQWYRPFGVGSGDMGVWIYPRVCQRIGVGGSNVYACTRPCNYLGMRMFRIRKWLGDTYLRSFGKSPAFKESNIWFTLKKLTSTSQTLPSDSTQRPYIFARPLP